MVKKNSSVPFEAPPGNTMKRVCQLRATLEGFAAREAATRVAQKVSAAPLLKQFRDMQQIAEAGDYKRFARADRALHRMIIELADVPGLMSAWQAVFRAQKSFHLQTVEICWPDISVLFESHRPLVDAIAIGDPNVAEEAALIHLDAVWFRLANSISDASLPSAPLEKARAWLAFHFHEPVQLPVLAREIAGCSCGHLARLFRESLDMSFSEYLIELRLQKGLWLLQHTERTIGEVASHVGYGDPSRFAMHFRRRFGETPQHFRQRLRRTLARK